MRLARVAVVVAQHLAVRDVAVVAQAPAAEVPEALRELPFRRFLVQPQPERERNLLPVEAVPLALARLEVVRHLAAEVVPAVVAAEVPEALHLAALRQAVAAVVSAPAVVAGAVPEVVAPQFQASRSSTCYWLPAWT